MSVVFFLLAISVNGFRVDGVRRKANSASAPDAAHYTAKSDLEEVISPSPSDGPTNAWAKTAAALDVAVQGEAGRQIMAEDAQLEPPPPSKTAAHSPAFDRMLSHLGYRPGHFQPEILRGLERRFHLSVCDCLGIIVGFLAVYVCLKDSRFWARVFLQKRCPSASSAKELERYSGGAVEVLGRIRTNAQAEMPYAPFSDVPCCFHQIQIVELDSASPDAPAVSNERILLDRSVTAPQITLDVDGETVEAVTPSFLHLPWRMQVRSSKAALYPRMAGLVVDVMLEHKMSVVDPEKLIIRERHMEPNALVWCRGELSKRMSQDEKGFEGDGLADYSLVGSGADQHPTLWKAAPR